MGTTAFVLPSLDALLAAGHDVVAVYTQPPRPAGRGHQLRRTPVHEAAERLGLDVRTPRTLKDPDAQAEFAALHADLAVVGAYGLLLPKPCWPPRAWAASTCTPRCCRAGAAPPRSSARSWPATRRPASASSRWRRGWIPGRCSRCDRWRSAPRPPPPNSISGWPDWPPRCCRRSSPGSPTGSLPAVPQPDEGVVYAHKLARDEGRLDFTLPAVEIERRLRALNPAPGTWCEAKGERLTLLAADVVSDTGDPGTVTALPLTIACGTNALRVTLAQRAGRRALAPDELQRGFPFRWAPGSAERCRATACCSNMTARRSRAGSARQTAPRSRRPSSRRFWPARARP